MSKPIKYKINGKLENDVNVLQDAYDHSQEYDAASRRAFQKDIKELFKSHQVDKRFKHVYIPSFGLLMLIVAAVFAAYNPFPSLFQVEVYWIVLMIFVGISGALITGFIEVKYQGWLSAGGATALIVVFYFCTPAIAKTQQALNEYNTFHLAVFIDDSSSVQKFNIKVIKNNNQALQVYLLEYMKENYGLLNQTDTIICFEKDDGQIVSTSRCNEIMNNNEILIVPINLVKVFPSYRDAYTHYMKKN